MRALIEDYLKGFFQPDIEVTLGLIMLGINCPNMIKINDTVYDMNKAVFDLYHLSYTIKLFRTAGKQYIYFLFEATS